MKPEPIIFVACKNDWRDLTELCKMFVKLEPLHYRKNAISLVSTKFVVAYVYSGYLNE